MGSVDVFAAIIMRVDLLAWPDAGGWAGGPLPLAIPPSPRNPRQGPAEFTDARARESMIGARGSALLYGQGARCHREVTDRSPSLPECIAVELLRFDAGQGHGDCLLVLHCEATVDDPIAWTSTLISRAKGLTQGDLATLGVDAGVRADARARLVVHAIASDDPSLTDWYPTSPDLWTDESAALFYLASGTTPESFPLSADRAPTPAPWPLSADWSCMVLRDGVAFVARTTTASSAFHATARVHVATVYVDAFLLSLIQLHAATSLADRVARVMADDPKADDAFDLEDALMRFRSRVWWSHLGDRETRVNEILRRAQEQQRTGDLVEEITAELVDIARLVAARQARGRERVTWVIAIASAFFLVPSLVFTAAATISDPTAGLFWVSLAVSVVLAGVALLALRLWMSPPGRARGWTLRR